MTYSTITPSVYKHARTHDDSTQTKINREYAGGKIHTPKKKAHSAQFINTHEQYVLKTEILHTHIVQHTNKHDSVDFKSVWV